MQNNTIFRKASLDRVSSPEQLNDYIKVSRLSVWLILAAVAVLLVGVCIWGIYGTLTTTRDAVAVAEDGVVTCYVSLEDATSISAGMDVQIGDSTGVVASVGTFPMEITTDFDAYALYLGGLHVGEWMIPVTVATEISDGAYMAEIVVESISPISFVVN